MHLVGTSPQITPAGDLARAESRKLKCSATFQRKPVRKLDSALSVPIILTERARRTGHTGRAAADDGLVFDTHKTSKESDATIRVAFIGAGGINFGKPGRPWNHARAVSSIPGVQVVGIADPDTTLVRERIREKLQGTIQKALRSQAEFLSRLPGESKTQLHYCN